MTETTEDEKLTTTETALRDTWARLAAGHTGATAKVHGWPEPAMEQVSAMTRILNEAITALVRGFRRPDAHPPTPGELDAVFEGMALGVLERVMGPPPSRETLH